MSRLAQIHDMVADPLIDVLGIFSCVLAFLYALEDLVCELVAFLILDVRSRGLPYFKRSLGFRYVSGTVMRRVGYCVFAGLVQVELGRVNV